MSIDFFCVVRLYEVQIFFLFLGIVVRQIADLLSLMQDLHHIQNNPTQLEVTQDDVSNVQVCVILHFL